MQAMSDSVHVTLAVDPRTGHLGPPLSEAEASVVADAWKTTDAATKLSEMLGTNPYEFTVNSCVAC